MKIQYISSACVLIEHQSVRVLCDPWLTEGIYFGSWYHYPLPACSPEDFTDVDYIYISHIHPDHCDVATLHRLPKSIPILIHDYEEKFLYHLIKKIGFQRIIEIPHQHPYILNSDFSVEILAADNCDPEKCGMWFGCQPGPTPTRTMQIDSLAVFHGGNKTLINNNDCPYELSKTVCNYIVQRYQTIDFLCTGYSGAGPYPQCFDNLTESDKISRAQAKKMQFLHYAIDYIAHLKPAFFLPFAGQYTLGGRLSELNAFRGVPELEELPELFNGLLKEKNLHSSLVLLNSGEWFDLETEKTSTLFQPPDPKQRSIFVDKELKEKKYSYELEPALDVQALKELEEKLKEANNHLQAKLLQFNYSTPTACYLDVAEDCIFRVPFDGKGSVERTARNECKEPFVKIKLDGRLLRMILERKAHWNNAEIGSHLRYLRVPDRYERGLHFFLSFLHA